MGAGGMPVTRPCRGDDIHGLRCSTITASKTSALAVAVSVMATQMSVTLRTPRILSGETLGSLSSLIYLPACHSSGFPMDLHRLLLWVSIFLSKEAVPCEPLRVSCSWVAICPEFHRGGVLDPGHLGWASMIDVTPHHTSASLDGCVPFV